jgi:Fanconi-associated nuclease 1
LVARFLIVSLFGLIAFIGTCVRVNDSVFALLRRLNLVYFRWCAPFTSYPGSNNVEVFSTQYTPDIMTPSILSRAHRRTFQQYVYKRSSDIWPTRTALLAYERALELEAQVDVLFNNALTPARARSRSRSIGVKADGARERTLGEGDMVKESQRIHAARDVLPIFEVAYAEWRALGECKCDPRPHGLERFDRGMSSCTVTQTSPQDVGVLGTLTGHVLTRIVQKGADALGTLKEYDCELEVLEALLNQRRWRRGRRGKWYERRALILTRYCDKSPETLMRTMRGLLDSLNDRDTHLGEWVPCLVNWSQSSRA